MSNLLFEWLQFEDAAEEVTDEITSPRPPDAHPIQAIQVMLSSKSDPVPIRELRVRFIYCKKIFGTK